MMSYWHHNVVNKSVKGTNTEQKQAKSLKKMTKLHPDRPWLRGVHRNIDHDSQLSNRNYYNPRDCIIPCVQHDLDGFGRIVNESMMQQLTENQLFRDGALCDGRVWNESTSMRMTEHWISVMNNAYVPVRFRNRQIS